jgi:hypothetical protein
MACHPVDQMVTPQMWMFRRGVLNMGKSAAYVALNEAGGVASGMVS